MDATKASPLFEFLKPLHKTKVCFVEAILPKIF